MKDIYFEKTDSTPEVDFKVKGELKLEGRSMPEDVSIIYDQLIEFVQKLETIEVSFAINMDYFNTATSKKLMDLLLLLEANKNIQIININWHYEEGDEDSLETAEIYEDLLLRSNFNYHEYLETAEVVAA